jgi:serine/threonine protein kinase/tetratricopeptide (TPR) repeat protein
MEITPESLVGALRSALAGKYEIERRLGAGGMGSVFLGRDLTLDRPVAIKVINPDLGLSATARQRFLQEARLVARLNHVNITDVYAAGEVDGLLYFIMEYVPGESLRELLDRERCCAPERASAILRDLAMALSYAHKQGVIHRDIKPENILLHRDSGEAKLTDFGVARAFRSEDERMTGTGMVVGTPRYMSPEQASGEREIDGRSDIYSLGLIGYEMFAGEPAFTGTTPGSVIMKQITEPPPPLLDRAKNVPPDTALVIERALEKDPANRFQDAGEMARALGGDEAILATTATRSATGIRKRARNRRNIAIGAGLAGLAAAGIWFVSSGSDIPKGVDPRKSFFVAPFENQTGDPAFAWLREGSVNMLTLNLASWRDLKVVEYERSLDLIRDAELDKVSQIGLDDARALARKAGVWTVVMGQITRTGDSLGVTARVYDVSTGERVKQAQLAVAASADPRSLFDRLSRELLDLAGAPAMTPALSRTTTGSLEAYRSYLNGLRQLNAWQLDSADVSFARAIRADSTFALAYLHRAQGLGWRPSLGDTSALLNARMAQRYAARLPARERGLIDAYVALSEGLRSQFGTDTSAQRRYFDEAMQRYSALAARDTTDVQALYGMGDAFFHAPTNSQQSFRRNWTTSLNAFDRTLRLDSTFHLAYPHKIQIYNLAATEGSNIILVGDSLVAFENSQQVDAYGRPRVVEARRVARDRVIEDARRWAEADPAAPESHRALADAYLAANRPDEAASTMRRAMQRPELRSGDFPYRAAAIELLAGKGDEAVASLKEALALAPFDSVKRYKSNTTFPAIAGAAAAASYSGSIQDMKKALDLAARVEPVLPFGGLKTSTKEVTDFMATTHLMAMGIEFGSLKKEVDASLRAMDAYGKTPPNELAQARMAGPYYAYIFGRDTSYLEWLRRFNGEQLLRPIAFQALLAMDRGDTAAVRRIAAGFPRGDTAKARASGPIGQLSAYVEAQILTELGDLRGALATYEGMSTHRYSVFGMPDPRWPLYTRSFLARGKLYEAVGERDKAIEAYERFLAIWKNADPRLEPQRREAREAVARLRDAPAATLKKSA